jgi:hypothetical protein
MLLSFNRRLQKSNQIAIICYGSLTPFMENSPHTLLEEDIHQLDISRSLLLLLELNRLGNLKELLARPMAEWFDFAGFNQHLLNELLNYLDQCALLPYVKD